MNIKEKLASSEPLTEQEATLVRATMRQFVKEAKEFPVLHGEALEKMAADPMTFRDMAVNTAKTVGAVGLFAGAANVVADLYESGKDAIMKSIRYKRMIDANPDLAQMDASKVQSAFSTLHKFNPHYASDPSVAGTFVKQHIHQEGVDFNTLKNVVDAGKSLRPARPTAMQHLTHPATMAGMVELPWGSKAAQMPSPEDTAAATLKRRADMLEHWDRLQSAGMSNPLDDAWKGPGNP